MASVGHFAVAAALARFGPKHGRDRWFTLLGLTALSFLPDADVVAFAVGIPYEHAFGHRGASHSIVFGIVVGAIAGLIGARRLKMPYLWPVLFSVVAIVSHGVLDGFTDGGLGAALAWPATDARYFFPWRPIPVAPIGPAFFSARGLVVAGTELLIFAPLFAVAWWPNRRGRDSAARTAAPTRTEEPADR